MFYEDNPRLIAEMLDAQWDLRMGDKPTIVYRRDAYMMHVRNGGIYVYQTNRTNRISTVDYRTLERQAYVSIRVSDPDREGHFRHCEEVYRILMANRRAGPDKLNGYLFMEVVDDLSMNDIQGHYTTTFDIRLKGYAHPIRSSGFGVDCEGEPIGDEAEPPFDAMDSGAL